MARARAVGARPGREQPRSSRLARRRWRRCCSRPGASRRRSAELDALAARDFADVPEDGDWMIAMTLLADVAAGLGDADAGTAAVRAAAALPRAQRRDRARGGLPRVGGALSRQAGAGDRRARPRRSSTSSGRCGANTALEAPGPARPHAARLRRRRWAGARARMALVEAARRAADELHLPAVTRRLEQLQRACNERSAAAVAAGATLRRPMTKTLVIAEKPSVGRDLVARAARARSPRARATSRGPSTSSRGRSATSCSSPTPTSTTTASRSGGWPTCRSCPSTSSSSSATSARRSR